MFVRPFDTENKQAENKNRAAGLIVTIVVHALLLLLLLFIYITPPDPPFEDNGGGTAVNFGTVDEGMGDQQQYTAVPVKIAEPVKENTPPPPPVAATAKEDLETQEIEDAAEIEKQKVVKKEKVKPIPEAVFKPTPKPVKPADPTPPKPKVNNDALFSSGAQGTPNKSKGDGTGNKAGDQGKPNGDPNSKNYVGNGYGNGSGNGPGTGDGPGGKGSGVTAGPGPGNVRLTGRSLRNRPPVRNPCENTKGRVVMEIRVNRDGRVTDAKFTQAGSNTADDCLINTARQAALKYTFDENSTAAETQTGSITFIFKED